MLAEIVARHGATERQVVLAWLLARSPGDASDPGTNSVDHLDANVAAAGLALDPHEVEALTECRG